MRDLLKVTESVAGVDLTFRLLTPSTVFYFIANGHFLYGPKWTFSLLGVINWCLCPPAIPKFTCWSSDPPICWYLEMGPLGGKWGLDEVLRLGPWSEEISALIRRNTRDLSLSMCMQQGKACAHTVRRWLSASQEKTQNEICIAGPLILDLIISRTERNKFLMLKPPSPWCFVIVVQADYRITLGSTESPEDHQ